MSLLAGIARHPRPRGVTETVDRASVTFACGIAGDYRGAMKGKPHKRQITLFEREDWELALAEVGRAIPWQERRANLLVADLDLPQTPGTRLRIGADVVLEITRECDPCDRMEVLAPGLRAALTADWRGGVCSFVVADGEIAVGDAITIEDDR